MNTGGHLLFGPSFNFKLSEKFEPEDPGDTNDDVKAFETSVGEPREILVQGYEALPEQV